MRRRGASRARRRAAAPARRIALAAAASVLIASLAGCTDAAALGTIVGTAMEPKAKALYRLRDVPTLVLVDDPAGALGDRTLTLLIADEVGYNLRKAKQLTQIIPADRLNPLEAEKGREFRKLSVAALAREVGADQVIAVSVEEAALQSEPGMLRPVMTARVRVVDATDGRLFPAVTESDVNDPARVTTGQPVLSTLHYRFSGDVSAADVAKATRLLAVRAGRDVARLFYDYRPQTPGEFNEG